MAANLSIEQNGGYCADCRGSFANDLANRGFRKHLAKLPKRRADGTIMLDDEGHQIMCGGTEQSWDKGNKS